MPRNDFLILLFITLLISNNGYEANNTFFLTDGNFWYLGIGIFFLVYLMWVLNRKAFQFTQKKIPIDFQKPRTLFPYFIVGYVISLLVYVIGLSLMFTYPPSFNSDTDASFELSPLSVLFTVFLLASFFLWSKVKNELAKKPKEIIREKVVEKNVTLKQNFQLRRGNSTFRIAQEDIAYFYLNNSMVYLMKTDGNSFPILDTLSQVKNQSENGALFAANRQLLISKKAVKAWGRTDTRKLNLEISPPISKKMTVSKNRASAFMEWMENSHERMNIENSM